MHANRSPVRTQGVLVWVNPLIADSNAVRYDLVGYVFRLGIGVEGEGTTSPWPFEFPTNPVAPTSIPYEVIIRLPSDLANVLQVPMSLRVANLLRTRAWIRILFQSYSISHGGIENHPIEGPPSSIYQSALNALSRV